MATVGFIGLGAMGSRMARRLLDAGHAVVGYNRTAAKAAPLVARGMTLASSPVRSSLGRLAPVLGCTSLAFGVWYALAALSLAPYYL